VKLLGSPALLCEFEEEPEEEPEFPKSCPLKILIPTTIPAMIKAISVTSEPMTFVGLFMSWIYAELARF
jgi:hypothetical protein